MTQAVLSSMDLNRNSAVLSSILTLFSKWGSTRKFTKKHERWRVFYEMMERNRYWSSDQREKKSKVFPDEMEWDVSEMRLGIIHWESFRKHRLAVFTGGWRGGTSAGMGTHSIRRYRREALFKIMEQTKSLERWENLCQTVAGFE